MAKNPTTLFPNSFPKHCRQMYRRKYFLLFSLQRFTCLESSSSSYPSLPISIFQTEMAATTTITSTTLINTLQPSSLQNLSRPKWAITNYLSLQPTTPSRVGCCRLKTSLPHVFSSQSFPTAPVTLKDYEFLDGSTEVELRLQLGGRNVTSSRDIFVDANGSSLTIKVQHSGSFVTLLETNQLFDKIKPAETIWYIDEDQLVINLKKHDPDLKWPDIVESWESLTAGYMQLLKGTSIFIVGDSTEINQKVAQELAVGLG